MKRVRLTAILFVIVTTAGAGLIKDGSLRLIESGMLKK